MRRSSGAASNGTLNSTSPKLRDKEKTPIHKKRMEKRLNESMGDREMR